jgi:hypothetical protein
MAGELQDTAYLDVANGVGDTNHRPFTCKSHRHLKRKDSLMTTTGQGGTYGSTSLGEYNVQHC